PPLHVDLVRGPDIGPSHSPTLGSAPAQPGRSSVSLVVSRPCEGPRHGPSHSPTLGSAPAQPGRSSVSLVVSRPLRGAPTWPLTVPHARKRPGTAGSLLGLASRQSTRDGPRSALILGRETVEILLPLDGKHRPLARIAVLARTDDVAAHRGAAAAEWNEMVHGERFGPDAAAAVIADAVRDAALPPRARAQLTRLRSLASELVWIDGRVELSHGPRAPSTASPTR